MTEQAIVVGASHNGLVCATYLARSGYQVTVLEAADHVGGAAHTREFADGFRVSGCAHLVYQLNEDDFERLMTSQRECVFNWCTKDSWPMGVIMSYIWRDGRVWLTAGAHRHRISAIRRNPQVSCVVTSTGTDISTR